MSVGSKVPTESLAKCMEACRKKETINAGKHVTGCEYDKQTKHCGYISDLVDFGDGSNDNKKCLVFRKRKSEGIVINR